jgi:hypothetical protein
MLSVFINLTIGSTLEGYCMRWLVIKFAKKEFSKAYTKSIYILHMH